MKYWRIAAWAVVAACQTLAAAAADLSGYSVKGACTFAEESQLALMSEVEIELQITAYYDEAAEALQSPVVVGSRSPAFLWAAETKFQCGKAIGYLAGGHLDEESVQKCDCFYGRFLQFR